MNRTSPLVMRQVALAAALAAAQIGAAHAQTAAPAPQDAASAPAAAEAQGDGLKLDAVVITGTSTARTKMKQSVSVSTVGAEQVQNSVAASATEVLRAVPGLRAESSGGEGNANLGVRGLPMSDGGGRYVQLQEDGLPVLLFGDISFSTADQYVRADYSLDSIDVVRGGSTSTLSTNAPGAIVNFRSQTGKVAGGAFGMSLGLDHKQQRADFQYGSAIGKDLYFSVGGFYRIGEGVRPTDVTAENGGQLKASMTKEFDGGYVRVHLKRLKDNTPTYMPVPVIANGSRLVQIPGVDPRTAFFVNSHFPQDVTMDRNGNLVATNPADGLQVNVNAVGVEAQFSPDSTLTVTNRFRKSSISGRFLGVFPAGGQPADYTGTTPVFSAHLFNTALDDLGNMFNDLRVQKTLALGEASKLTLTGGLFSGTQRIAQTWDWNRYNFALVGEGTMPLDNAGNPTTQPVDHAQNSAWGARPRGFDIDVTAVAPYGALTWDMGPLSVDASLRRDKIRGTGWQRSGDAITNTWNDAARQTVRFADDATSYSLGANYELSRNLAGFGRFSQGVSWKSPDRFSGSVLTGTEALKSNEVRQLEAGVKWRQSGLSVFATAFFAKTEEAAGFELTSQTFKQNAFDSKGVELEMAYRIGNFAINGGATYTKAKITGGDNVGNVPRRQADLIYQIAPSYTFGNLEVGGSLIGTTKSFAQNDNVVVQPAFAVVNAFANYELARNTMVSVGVNNLFDKLGYTEAEPQNNLGTNPLYIARAVNGRSIKATLKYTF